ncbi:LysR substrate-binding domain-containing protein [Coralloluteibacterium stylophorae]|uniref:LysR family transcriptional regulator n=1 Tax=Coralloluteibacterium stylophorae TaxID=1776034 RepID=A0A8J7VYK8_9GAMM|nr:LysR substrate-binding domain-containing protein [Coralloluteibacterium stylophorae]MBS7457473.1 LysR family transcriptional regulator [Coralloluteibacterium stylophorae]
MQDLNDLYYFAMVVEHNGFAAAERALGIPKSRLSRRIAQLESGLGVRLLQRSTRRFAVTDVGQSVYRHAQAMLAEAQSAREVVDRLSAEPRGLVKVSAPVGLAQTQMARLVPDFLTMHPQVRLQMVVSNRRVDVINEGFDVALRVRSHLNDDGSLVMRSFGHIQELLVASPAYLDRAGRPAAPGDLAQHVTLSMSEEESRQRWDLHGPDGSVTRVDLQPRLMGSDFPLLREAAIQGLGITLLPETMCADDVRNGTLEVVLPQWNLPQGICHAVFPSRRGLLPAVRLFIDFLAERLPPLIEASRLDCSRHRAGQMPAGNGSVGAIARG